jgi:hypothetical protein
MGGGAAVQLVHVREWEGAVKRGKKTKNDRHYMSESLLCTEGPSPVFTPHLAQIGTI